MPKTANAAVEDRQMIGKYALVTSNPRALISVADKESVMPKNDPNAHPRNSASIRDARINIPKSEFVSGENANRFSRLRFCMSGSLLRVLTQCGQRFSMPGPQPF